MGVGAVAKQRRLEPACMGLICEKLAQCYD